MPDADTITEEYLTAAQLALEFGLTKFAIVRWGKCGVIRVLERAHGPRDSLANRYSVADVRRVAGMSPADRNAMLKAAEKRSEWAENEKRASRNRGTVCCSLCGRDTNRRSGVCSRCD